MTFQLIRKWCQHERDMPDRRLPCAPRNEASCNVYSSRLHQNIDCAPLTLTATLKATATACLVKQPQDSADSRRDHPCLRPGFKPNPTGPIQSRKALQYQSLLLQGALFAPPSMSAENDANYIAPPSHLQAYTTLKPTVSGLALLLYCTAVQTWSRLLMINRL